MHKVMGGQWVKTMHKLIARSKIKMHKLKINSMSISKLQRRLRCKLIARLRDQEITKKMIDIQLLETLNGLYSIT